MEKKSLLSAAYEVLLASDKPLQFKELFTSSGLEFNLDETGEKPEGLILAYECKASGGDLLGAAAICT